MKPKKNDDIFISEAVSGELKQYPQNTKIVFKTTGTLKKVLAWMFAGELCLSFEENPNVLRMSSGSFVCGEFAVSVYSMTTANATMAVVRQKQHSVIFLTLKGPPSIPLLKEVEGVLDLLRAMGVFKRDPTSRTRTVSACFPMLRMDKIPTVQ